jgi:hypothetical protein
MSIAREMDAPLTVLALLHARLARMPDTEALCTQLVSAQQHLEELRLDVLALEELAIGPRHSGGGQVISLDQHRPRPRLVQDAGGAT